MGNVMPTQKTMCPDTIHIMPRDEWDKYEENYRKSTDTGSRLMTDMYDKIDVPVRLAFINNNNNNKGGPYTVLDSTGKKWTCANPPILKGGNIQDLNDMSIMQKRVMSHTKERSEIAAKVAKEEAEIAAKVAKEEAEIAAKVAKEEAERIAKVAKEEAERIAKVAKVAKEEAEIAATIAREAEEEAAKLEEGNMMTNNPIMILIFIIIIYMMMRRGNNSQYGPPPIRYSSNYNQ
jgi:hypothetical protein